MSKGIFKNPEERKKKISEGLKKAYKSGKRNPWNKNKHCSVETKNKMSLAHKGQKGYWTGKKRPPFSDEWKCKIGKANSKALKGRMPPHTKTKEFADKMRILKSGEKSNFWKGGVSKLSDIIKASAKYRQWRESIFERDNFTCQKCRKRGGILHPHHKEKQFAVILEENNIKTLEQAMRCEELWDIKNGETLCKKCHKTTETYGAGYIKKI